MTAFETTLLLSGCIAIVAFLYSSVGHAGASGYIAVMTLFGLGMAEVKPAALTLNILVASVTAWQFWRAGHFSWRLFVPFALPAIPMAFLGGYLNLPIAVLKILVGIVLLVSAMRFVYDPSEVENPQRPRSWLAMISGGLIGLLSGITGTGGGIFLSPIMLLMKWARTKETAAISAMFILVNSTSGLAGNVSATKHLPQTVWLFLAASLLGGVLGSYLGSRHFSTGCIKKLLAGVLTIAGLKLLLQ